MAAKPKEDQHEEMEDDTSSDSEVDESLKTTEEEKRGTIPGSAEATAMALAGSRAQANPTVERGPPKKKKKKKKKKSKDDKDKDKK